MHGLQPVKRRAAFDRRLSSFLYYKNAMLILLTIVHVIVCIFLIIVVLLQSGRLDRWIASIRGTDLADAHLFLPMWIVHLSTVLLLVWIAVLVVKTSPKGFYITKMPPLLKSIVPIGILVFAGALTSYAADLSPANWPKAERERLEKLESQTWSPLEERSVEGSAGIISATVSPLSTYAGIQALKQGGNAADAAATTALTQVTMQLGSVVSYAGIFTMLYYDAKAHQVYSMDAGYNSYLQETDPKG